MWGDGIGLRPEGDAWVLFYRQRAASELGQGGKSTSDFHSRKKQVLKGDNEKGCSGKT